jgi:hypothetical protein
MEDEQPQSQSTQNEEPATPDVTIVTNSQVCDVHLFSVINFSFRKRQVLQRHQLLSLKRHRN